MTFIFDKLLKIKDFLNLVFEHRGCMEINKKDDNQVNAVDFEGIDTQTIDQSLGTVGYDKEQLNK